MTFEPTSVSAPSVINPEVLRDIPRTASGIPRIDLHLHLKGGLTLGDLLKHAEEDSLRIGVAVNCGRGFPVQDDAAAEAFFEQMQGHPVFVGMQAEGREWTSMFSQDTISKFDYIFTDAMTWTDNHGRRMRLWIADEVGEIPDAQAFMETLVARTIALLDEEPIDIFVNPTYLPDALVARYDELWTEGRMTQVIEAAARSRVAIELNDLYSLPGERFVHMAKDAGCKFTFGSNNTGPHNLGRLSYGMKMAAACKLVPEDFFIPGTGLTKAALRKRQGLREQGIGTRD